MGKTRYPFKRTRDTREIFHAKMGTIKEINKIEKLLARLIKKKEESNQQNQK